LCRNDCTLTIAPFLDFFMPENILANIPGPLLLAGELSLVFLSRLPLICFHCHGISRAQTLLRHNKKRELERAREREGEREGQTV
jgi:hypothetical protein